MPEHQTRFGLSAPFPYFGGKSKIAPLVWDILGDVPNYVEPFFGSGAMLFNRPASHVGKIETVNDFDGMVSNFWRAIRADPELVAHYAGGPVNEADLHARHLWLVREKESLASKLMANPDYYDPKAAGWWCWGLSIWIGSGFCSGTGAWTEIDGEFVKQGKGGRLPGVGNQVPNLGDAGRGVIKTLESGRLPGVGNQVPNLANGGKGVIKTLKTGTGLEVSAELVQWFSDLSGRLNTVRVCVGDWSRVLGTGSILHKGTCGIFLDPPYGHDVRAGGLYAHDVDITRDVEKWCLENGHNPKLRIVLCGYEGEYNLPGWSVVPWKANGGYQQGKEKAAQANAGLERLWCSPGCIELNQKLNI